jgi:hypothetical protein
LLTAAKTPQSLRWLIHAGFDSLLCAEWVASLRISFLDAALKVLRGALNNFESF